MFCAKCKFNSFEHLSKCPNCGFDWKEAREALQLAWLQSEGYNWFQRPFSEAVLAEEIGYDFSAFEEKTGQLSDADSSKPTALSDPSGANKDERS